MDHVYYIHYYERNFNTYITQFHDSLCFVRRKVALATLKRDGFILAKDGYGYTKNKDLRAKI